MQAAGIADERNVRLLRQRLIQRRERANVVNLFNVALFIRAHRRRNDMRKPPHAVRDNLDGASKQRPQVPRMPLTDAAETNNQDLHECSFYQVSSDSGVEEGLPFVSITVFTPGPRYSN
jgi:hypothetical protein